MTSVIICEKPSQARNLRAALGDRHGRILAAQGHLLRLEEPEEVNAEWKNWSHELLVPPNGRYGYRADTGGGKADKLREIRAALKSASRVIIATDCDREGQAIGEELVRFLDFRGEVLRAMFSAEDEKSLRDAFAALVPNEKYRKLYDAAVARQQADQIYNLTLTRSATLALRPDGWNKAIGIGRVKTPTLAIVCRREIEITEFRAREFFEVGVSIAGTFGEVELWHRPKGDARIFDRARADLLASGAGSYAGPVSVEALPKSARPPLPLDLPALQKAAGKWGWTASHTLDMAQALYERHKITTYPRAETRHLPESMADTAPRLLDALRDLPGLGEAAPVSAEIRHGKGAAYSDAGLKGASHHAIIPNINLADRFAEILGELSADKRRLFVLIAQTWLATVSPDHRYMETSISITPQIGDESVVFGVKGRATIAQGWKAIFSADDDGEEDEEGAVSVPPLQDGEAVRARSARVLNKMTTPPQRYNEGELIDAMQNAWRFLDDPAERDRLKEAKGIGTPATRGTVIEGLKAQQFMSGEKGRVRPTELGLWLFRILDEAAHHLVDVGATARMENQLDAVLEGTVSADAVISSIADRARSLVDMIQGAKASAPAIAVQRAPSPKMLEAARAKAKRDGGRLPAGVAADFDACRAYLGPLTEGPRVPSDAQLGLARRLAGETGAALPDEALSDARALSAWIDQQSRGQAPRLASDKQMEWVRKLVDQGKPAPKGYPDAVTAEVASRFLDAAFKKKGGQAGGQKARRP